MTASHVELSFKDEYLARSDMWRLAINELSNRTVYKSQKIVFLGTIKAQVTSVYFAGSKVQSAFFSPSTKPIFRSESARFVLFIQMSREMWDFDSEGSGEIMFTKVVNGFLPALFKRWVALKARHLVSIVLFTRVEYDTGLTSELVVGAADSTYHTGIQVEGARKPYKDFYRVVVSEMASGEWTTILYQLKHEFRYFRRDISMHRLNALLKHSKLVSNEGGMGSVPGTRIEAEPTLAIHGNLLEAINLASTQYSRDYIDRDLVRTGISIVVITPGAGLFEVDYEMLRMTTETLVSNGIGIDLVCLPKIPLHSVPIFRYRNPQYFNHHDVLRMKDIGSLSNTPQQGGALFGSYSTLHESLSPSKASGNFRNQRSGILTPKRSPDQWSYAIPHWIDVSFWTGASQDLLSREGVKLQKDHRLQHGVIRRKKDFAVRCKMYELEMSSISNDGIVEISVDPLPNNLRPQEADQGPGRLVPTELTTIRGLRKHASLSEQVLGPTRPVVDKKSTQADRGFFEGLDSFDDKAALLSESEDKGHSKGDPRKHVRIGEENSMRKILADDPFGTSFKDDKDAPNGLSFVGAAVSSRKKQDSRMDNERPSSRKGSINSAMSTVSNLLSTRPAKISRQISLGNRGFGIAAPKASVAELQIENANAARASNPFALPTISSSIRASRLLPPPHQEKTLERPTSPQSSLRSPKDTNQSPGTDGEKALPSRPIAIKNMSQSPDVQGQYMARSMLGSLYEGADANGKYGDLPMLQKLKSSDSLKASKSKMLSESFKTLPTTLSPTTALSPWLTILNPSNPTVADNVASQYKRWQHVFPRPLRTKAMKWKSLCSPASIPLTTEYFPTMTQLNVEYQQKPYTISHDVEEDLNEEPKSREDFIKELIGLRLSHGFQIVVGPAVAEAFGQKSLKIGNPFDRDCVTEDGASCFLSMGNTIHQLSCVNGTEVEVNMFIRKVAPSIYKGGDDVVRKYRPAISTTLDKEYESREILLGMPQEDYNWNYVDSFIAGQDVEMTESLRFWRARFVLIPVQQQDVNHRRRGEDNEEETRLEGIRALTQMWQKHRYMPRSERQFHSLGSRKGKDPNPLDIVYHTQDPSVVVNAELEALTSADAGEVHVRRGQLLSESERFRKANLNISALVDAIQAPADKGGVRMQNRRWHFRLHYNCFIGSDMTTWLLENFEDIQTREEAEELGNMLMAKDEERKARDKELAKDTGNEKEREKDNGIFVHVENRHPFRDGQYFYQVVADFAKPRPEIRGPWPFTTRRRETSVPSTPMTESIMSDSPRPERTQSSSGTDDRTSNSGTTTPTISGSRKQKVALSKVMKYDLDPRKRSYRPERINLHYDRLHNPDNCYHIRIDWMNVTAKLIEDAIQSWATTAERYGLRLIEVPIAEACTITETHPFRRPYIIQLALSPPDRQPPTYFDATSLAPQVSTSRHYYQKAILKKFDFVLDVEAAQNFPANVEVQYSWGRPDYKYSQYIHRSGVLLAEITDEGNFLLVANKMYNNRAMASREQEKFKKADHIDRAIRMVSAAGQVTPISSPMLRPAIGSPAASDVLGPCFPGSKLASLTTPESINHRLEAFCLNAALLDEFYKEVFEKATPPSATPPTFPRTEQNQHTLEQNIPTLGLPPGVFPRETSPSPMRLQNPLPRIQAQDSDPGSGPTNSPRETISSVGSG